MPKVILQIENMTAEDLLERLRDIVQGNMRSAGSVEELTAKTQKDTEAIRLAIQDALIDRKFIKRNVAISDRRIAKYERDGVLVPIANPKDLKSAYYKFSDFEKLMKCEYRRQYPNVQ